MKRCIALVLVAGMSAATPVLASDYSDLRPSYKSQIKPPPENLGTETLVELTVKIVSIDKARHHVTFIHPQDGMKTIIPEDPSVLAKLKPGDMVDVSYYKGNSFDLVDPKEYDEANVVTLEGEASGAGQNVAKARGLAIGILIDIISVDPYKKTVIYRLPGQQPREISLDTPRLRPLLTKLKDGDTMRLIAVEAKAARLVPR